MCEPTDVVLSRRADASSCGADASVLEPTGVVPSHHSGAPSGGAGVAPTNEQWLVTCHGCVHRSVSGSLPACRKQITRWLLLKPCELTIGYIFCTQVCFRGRLPDIP